MKSLNLFYYIGLFLFFTLNSAHALDCDPQHSGPLASMLESAPTTPVGPLANNLYELQQAQVLFSLPNQQNIEIQYLKTPDNNITGLLICPTSAKIENIGPNLKIAREALISTIELKNNELLLVDGTSLWEVGLVADGDEVYLMDSRQTPLSLKSEGLSPNSLNQVPDIKVLPTENGLLIQYLNVLLYYKKVNSLY